MPVRNFKILMTFWQFIGSVELYLYQKTFPRRKCQIKTHETDEIMFSKTPLDWWNFEKVFWKNMKWISKHQITLLDTPKQSIYQSTLPETTTKNVRHTKHRLNRKSTIEKFTFTRWTLAVSCCCGYTDLWVLFSLFLINLLANIII